MPQDASARVFRPPEGRSPARDAVVGCFTVAAGLFSQLGRARAAALPRIVAFNALYQALTPPGTKRKHACGGPAWKCRRDVLGYLQRSFCIMTIHLPKDVESSINAEVMSGHFASADDAIAAAWRAYLESRQGQSPAGKPAPSKEAAAPARKPIWERIQDMTADVPDEEWDKLPTDLAEQHDHYIYGTPKRPTE
jgi:Arc/MetJ-type ribon-helix-helix transcriptional regulator